MDHLDSMRVFVKVVDLGGFARAASALRISNAVATRHVADLEGHLGTRLLNRTTRSLSPTESGQVYLKHVRQILEELDDVEQMVTSRNQEPAGTLRMVAPVVFGLHKLAPVLQRYAARYPRVVPDITLVDRQVDLVEEGFDVGIVIERNTRHAGVVTRPLTTAAVTVCATPDYLHRHGTPTHPEQLVDYPCLFLSSSPWGEGWIFTGRSGETRVSPTNKIAANNMEMLRQFALLGMGIAVLPSYLIEQDIQRGALVPLLAGYRLPQIEINIVYPSRRYFPAKLRTFIHHLFGHFNPTPQGATDVQADAEVAAAQPRASRLRTSQT